MARKYIRYSIYQLEAAFERCQNDPSFLRDLLEELSHRKTERAAKLHQKATNRFNLLCATASAIDGEHVPRQPADEPPLAPSVKAVLPCLAIPAPASQLVKIEPLPPIPPVTNKAHEILSAWTALEVLSPQSFARPEDLASGDRRMVAMLDSPTLPWERHEKSRPNCRLYYQIVLGAVKLEPAISRLIERYGDSRPERPSAKGCTPLAIVIVDRDGLLAERPAVTVSSFGWGIMTALNGRISDLARWSEVETSVAEKLENQLLGSRGDEEADKRLEIPLARAALVGAYQMLVAEFGLPPEFVEPPAFAIRSYTYFKDPNPPEALLLNSFFLKDLARAQELFASGKAPENLKRYLGLATPPKRHDLLRDRAALEQAVSPAKSPLSRWPGPGRHPLALLQQAAVNLALDETRTGGLLGVNGPPGTGKTTLLRDVVAAVVTERAEAMIGFNDPESAFEHSGEKLRAGDGWLHLYQIAQGLRGFEMVVASSNNRAVENVSAELPGMSAIAGDAEGLRYFKVLSDAVHGRDTWGMIAAVLGNAQNRSRFKQAFWWDEDTSFNRYLAAGAGSHQQIQEKDPATGKVTYRLPRIVLEEKPPASREEALERWQKARRRFLEALERSRHWQKWLAQVRESVANLDRLKAAEANAAGNRAAALERELLAAARFEEAKIETANARAKEWEWQTTWAAHAQSRPGFFARLFRTSAARAWGARASEVQTFLRKAAQQAADSESELFRRGAEVKSASESRTLAETSFAAAKSAREKAEKLLHDARNQGVVMADSEYFAQEHGKKHRSTPWFPPAAQKARDDLFIAAMDVHHAFADAAAKPLRHNLGALMNVFSSQTLPTEGKRALLPHLWSSLFLTVPLVSTTFAAVERMLGRLPPESLGWLLVDEAGQALPQAAVGAIMRTRKALIVGDPVQIEPVVMLPDSLVRAICRQMGVDPDRYGAPSASVQTLADAASIHTSEFQTRTSSRMAGVPLLVHRRCAEPMFGVSNSIAYAGLMVSAKSPGCSPIREILGPSRWYHVEGHAEDKWCAQEGAVVVQLLHQLGRFSAAPDLYIITPFVIVADRLRHQVRESRTLNGWMPDDEVWAWTRERIGTVHTVQGREAEAVIFVLGAPSPAQTGARMWAGGRPNLLNVAVTRAKEVIYVVGNRHLWRQAGLFSQLDAGLPPL
ncbi:MAG: AAA domain-containing protein [Verrucomicrobiota bacterium]